MKLHIKYMVSLRCKMAVKMALDSLGLHYTKVELGEVDLENDMTVEQRELLKKMLLRSGLELMEGKKAALVENIKHLVIEMVHYEDELPKTNISTYFRQKLYHSYVYLSTIFSEATGMTIAQYILNHKIEKVKELILYNELSLTEISYKLHYSSVAHLSNQFKKVTGLTPTFFRQMMNAKKELCQKQSAKSSFLTSFSSFKPELPLIGDQAAAKKIAS